MTEPSLSLTTLLVILGASQWPAYPEFASSQAFANAATSLRAYFLDPHCFGLSEMNLLDLFDSPMSADEQDERIGRFLSERQNALRVTGIPARDLIIFFVGHGYFVGRDSDFYLAIRRTRAENARASGLAMEALADTIVEQARRLRRYFLLDCCFAGSAFRAFQTNPAQLAVWKTFDVFEVKQKGIQSRVPDKGTALLCSSDHKNPSLLLPDQSNTMFSSALIAALQMGDLHQTERLSLRNLKELMANQLDDIRNREAPRPVLHSPDQSVGDIADVPLFPNPAYISGDETRNAVSAPPLSLTVEHPAKPKVEDRSPRRVISRRNMLIGMAGLVAVSGGITWFSLSREGNGSHLNSGVTPSTSSQAPTCSQAFPDDFTSSYDKRWQWMPEGNATIQVIDGALAITTPAGHDLYMGKTNAPKLLQPLPEKMMVETSLKFAPKHTYQGAGLLIQDAAAKTSWQVVGSTTSTFSMNTQICLAVVNQPQGTGADPARAAVTAYFDYVHVTC